MIRIQHIGEFNSIQLDVLRLDEVHPTISGNKWFKLKYNLQEAQNQQKNTLLTFGGAFSNHIYAVAHAGKEFQFQTIGIIRGEELANQWQTNPTLSEAVSLGMKLYFVSRNEYREKEKGTVFQEIYQRNMYVIPEGGTNEHAIKGTMEIITNEHSNYDFIACSVGTGGTISGLSLAAKSHQTILGFSSLKNADFLHQEIERFSHKKNFKLFLSHHFGGYGKVTTELMEFITLFQQKYNVPLDPIYTAKMMLGLTQEIEKGSFAKNSKILAIHTGGLQGVKGMKIALQKKHNETQHEK